MIVGVLFCWLEPGGELGGRVNMKLGGESFAVFAVSMVVDTGVDCWLDGNMNGFVWFEGAGTESLMVEVEDGKIVAVDVVGACNGKTKDLGGLAFVVDAGVRSEGGVLEDRGGSVSRFCLAC